MSQLRIGSLFSGAGLLDLAIEEIFDAHTVWVSDIEPGPVKVLAHRFPDAIQLGDITKIDWHTVPEVDLVGAGSPCQDISSAGRMQGMTEGTRSNLWAEMREAIRISQPMFVVWENVQAARSTKAATRYWPDHIDRCIAHHQTVAKETRHAPTKARHRRAAHRLMEQRARRVGVPYPKPPLRALGRVLGDLAHLGFDAEWISLPASGVGAPHKRLRYFVLAADTRGQAWLQWRFATTGQASRGRALGELAGRDRAPVALLGAPRAAAGITANLNVSGRDPKSRLEDQIALLPTPTVAERTNRSASAGAAVRPPLSGVATLLPKPSAVAQLPTPRATRGGGSTEIVELLPTPSVADSEGGHLRRGGDRSGELLLKGIAAKQVWGPYAAAIARWEAIVGPAPAPTKPGLCGQPKLNPEFAEWMMGAAPGWITDVPGVTDNEALRMAGNGVVQQQAVAALHLLMARMAAWGEESAA